MKGAVKASGIRKHLQVEVVPGPGRTRGCATVHGNKIVIQIAPPSKMSRRKLAGILRHELLHIAGLEHDDMTEHDLWSKGGEPEWMRRMPLRYRRRGEKVEDTLR